MREEDSAVESLAVKKAINNHHQRRRRRLVVGITSIKLDVATNIMGNILQQISMTLLRSISTCMVLVVITTTQLPIIITMKLLSMYMGPVAITTMTIITKTRKFKCPKKC